MIKRATSSNIQANLKCQVIGWKRPLMTKRAREVSWAGEPPCAAVDAQSEAPGCSGSLVFYCLLSNIHNSQQARECWTFHGSSLQGTWSHWGTSQGPAPSWVGSINHKQEKYFITSHHRYRYFLVQTSPEKNIFFNLGRILFAISAIPRTNICLTQLFTFQWRLSRAVASSRQ